LKPPLQFFYYLPVAVRNMPLTIDGPIITAATPNIGAQLELIREITVSFKSVQPEVIAAVSATVKRLAAEASPTSTTLDTATTAKTTLDAFIFYSLSSLEKIALIKF
ncbi:MAG: hypothetical protein ABL911_03040, partial [Gallionella sp.]